MIERNDNESTNQSQIKRFFSDQNAAGFYEWHNWSAEKGLERLVFQVSRNPKRLQAHLERIYYCFQEHLDDQLLGALIDLLIVLNNTGLALGKRMVSGSKSRLNENQAYLLENYLANASVNSDSLPANRYSVFAKGLLSNKVMVSVGSAG
jgi:hypothetical protein